jgi:hypothetical protein
MQYEALGEAHRRGFECVLTSLKIPVGEHQCGLNVRAIGMLKPWVAPEAMRHGGSGHMHQTELFAGLVDVLRIFPRHSEVFIGEDWHLRPVGAC